MDMFYFFISAGVRSGGMKQTPTSQYNGQKLGSLELWSELQHKVWPRPKQVETLGMEGTHLKCQIRVEFQFLVSLQILNDQPSLRTGDSTIFCEKLHSFLL